MKGKKILTIIFSLLLFVLVQGCNSKSVDDLYNQRADLATDEVKIKIDDVNEIANFFPVMVDGVKMEVIAVRASDDTVRVALNACQVCADSGRGHYVQDGKFLICQNCGNMFSIDQIGIIKGGCNPVPVLEDERYEDEGYVIVPKESLSKNKDLFVY